MKRCLLVAVLAIAAMCWIAPRRRPVDGLAAGCGPWFVRRCGSSVLPFVSCEPFDIDATTCGIRTTTLQDAVATLARVRLDDQTLLQES